MAGNIHGVIVKGGKALLEEAGPCMPFIVSCPGLVPEGVVTDALTDFTDLLPTFVVPTPAKLDSWSYFRVAIR